MPAPDEKPNTRIEATQASEILPATASRAETVGFPRSDAPPLPERIGEYVVLGEIGRGGMGVVYRAEDPHLKREIALKVMLPQFAANPDAKARFVREARAQAKVEHDHVAAIFQVAEQGGVPYLVMPLLKGMTLQAAIKANPRPPLQEVIRIGREVAEGLAAAHEKGLVHRDIKPANVWLEGKKLRVKVLDFGLARVADADATDATDGPVTAEGAIVGTPAYMSPEQARGDAVDFRTDLFSLGVLLYQMSAGELPFQGKSALAVLSALALHVPPPLIMKNPSVPPALSHLVDRLLSKSAAGRPPTAEVVAEELRTIELSLTGAVRVIPLGDVPPIVVAEANAGPDPFADLDATEANSVPAAEAVDEAEPASVRMQSKPRSGFPVWATVGGVLLAVAGVVGFVMSQMGKKPEEVVKEETPPQPITPKPVVVPKVAAVDTEREVAKLLTRHAHLGLRVGNPSRDVAVDPGQALPAEPFEIIEINFHADIPPLPADFVEKAMPQIARLGSLMSFYDEGRKLHWTDEQLANLGKSASLLKTLTTLAGDIDPTPKAWESLRPFQFHMLKFSGARATDASVAELPQFPAVRFLTIRDVGKSEKFTIDGWETNPQLRSL